MFTRAVAHQVDSLMNGTLFVPGWSLLPLKSNVRSAADKAGMQQLCHEFLSGARAAAAAGEAKAQTAASSTDSSAGPGSAASLLDILVSATDSEDAEASQPAGAAQGSTRAPLRLSDTELVDQVLTFLLAGHETSSKAITYALYLLAKHPEWQARLRAEAKAVCGSSDNASPPTFEQLSDMPLLHCVVYETLRLFPPAPYFDRYAMKDVSVQATAAPGAVKLEHEAFAHRPLLIPKGCVVTFPVVLIHRDPRYWDDPEEFNPLRFKDGIGAACRHPMAYLPFAHGPRNCIGSQFALLEIRTALATLLLRYEWELSPSYRHKPVYKITVDAKFGMPLRIRRIIL